LIDIFVEIIYYVVVFYLMDMKLNNPLYITQWTKMVG